MKINPNGWCQFYVMETGVIRCTIGYSHNNSEQDDKVDRVSMKNTKTLIVDYFSYPEFVSFVYFFSALIKTVLVVFFFFLFFGHLPHLVTSVRYLTQQGGNQCVGYKCNLSVVVSATFFSQRKWCFIYKTTHFAKPNMSYKADGLMVQVWLTTCGTGPLKTSWPYKPGGHW